MSNLMLPAGPLVSTAWLADQIGNQALRIVDVRGVVKPPTDPKPHYSASAELYAQGHIPGAVFVDWTRDIVDLSDPVPVQIAPPAQYAELMSRLGISDDTCVVAYDTTVPFFAARLLWTLRYYGHSEVRVLDGGIKKWHAEGRPLETVIPQYAEALFTPRPQPALRRTVEDVLAALAGPSILIDGRSAEEFHGEQSRATRGGHIPGARNVPYRDLVTGPYDTFAPPEQLRERFLSAGVDIEETHTQDVIMYCNGGVSALVTVLGMELAGGPEAALYDGSWNEWGNREDLPLER